MTFSLAKERRADWLKCHKEADMNLKEYKTKKMNDPEFVKAYEEIKPEMNEIRETIDARISQNMKQISIY